MCRFPASMRHLLWHLFTISASSVNPKGAPEPVEKIRELILREGDGAARFDEAGVHLQEVEAGVPEWLPGGDSEENLASHVPTAENVANQHALTAALLGEQWPVLRAMPRFGCEDENGKSSGRGCLSDVTKCDGDVRRKMQRGRPVAVHATQWAKGLLVLSCPHRFIYFIMGLLDYESVRDMCTALYTRIPRDLLPDVFVMDNACKLEHYIARRFPVHFKNVKFVVDGFHYGAPTNVVHNCGEQFMRDLHSTAHGLSGDNTSAVESINAWLRRLEVTIRHMTQSRYMSTVEFMSDLWNEVQRYRREKKNTGWGLDL